MITNPIQTNRDLASLGPPIAAGRTAEIYAWSKGQVVKLLREGFPPILVYQEALGTRTAYQAGMRVPEPGEMVIVGGRLGLILERVEGPTLIQAIGRRPHLLVGYSKLLGQLHAQIHAIHAPELPSQKERFAWQLNHVDNLPVDITEILLKMLDGLPEGDRLCHGDFHPENVILTTRGPVILDWEPAMRGSPAGDVAITCLWIRSLMTYFTGARRLLVGLTGRLMEGAYFDGYRQFAPGELDRLEDWITIKAAIRFGEVDRVVFDWLERLIRKKIPNFRKL